MAWPHVPTQGSLPYLLMAATSWIAWSCFGPARAAQRNAACLNTFLLPIALSLDHPGS
eukprot:COSAG01_NODE_2326_length_7903_cov_22.624552_6_plen_58_part_00